ncbi:MAG TPA: hypothetical protein VL330_20975 [Actinomycetes bacterium]|nr:hypothetical protein [Actinomycetes bacterium]
MHRSRQGIGAAVAVVLSLSLLGCTGGGPGADRADLQADTGTSSTLESSASTAAGESGGQPSEATPTSGGARGAAAGTRRLGRP